MNSNVWVLMVSEAVAIATVLTLAALGGLINERAGVINLGTEGMMLVGAISAFLGGRASASAPLVVAVGLGVFLAAMVSLKNAIALARTRVIVALAVALTAALFTALGARTPWLALFIGMLGGALLAVPHAVLTISLRAQQIVSGLALVIFGTGLANFLGEPIAGEQVATKIRPIAIPVLSDVPILGPILFRQDLVTWCSWVLVAVVGFVLFRTRLGLALRSVGEAPEAADVQGISVTRIRYGAVIVGGGLAGLAGAELMLARIPSWAQGATTNGIGFVALALVVFAGWQPRWILAGAMLFAVLLRAPNTIQLNRVSWLPDALQSPNILEMLPYVVTIAVLFLRAATANSATQAPAALGRPYVRDER